jgi:hypothetical protein
MRSAQPSANTPALSLVQRWRRAQMHVRCGLSAHQPRSVRAYLHLGLELTRRGLHPPLAVHMQMLNTLLQAGQDEALPWFWRSVCLEHVNLPLARLTTLLAVHDPIATQALQCAVQRAQDGLPATPVKPGRAKPNAQH